MSVDLVPETAPFSPAQRAWLNGFLAGMLGTLDTSHNDPSQLVSAQRIAPLLSPEDRLPAASSASVTPASDEVTAEEAPWHDPTLPVAERMALAAGRPLAQRMMAAMAQLNCGSCGYQCQTYAEALASGAEKNLSLCSPGGNETAKLLRQLHKERTALPASTTSTALVSSAASAEPSQTSELAQPRESGSRSQPIIARIKSNVPLNQSGSAKDTRHVAIALQGTPLKYRVGDALGILPTNCPQLVQQVCNAAGLAPQTLVPVKGCRQSLEEVLSERCLRLIPSELVERAVERVRQRPKFNGAVAADATLAERLQQFCDTDALGEWDILEFLTAFGPLDLTADDLVQTLGPLRPRLYSIASSQSHVPDEVHLTVGRVAEEVRGRIRKGVASTLLADRLTAGASVRVFVQPNHGFTIPADPKADMIMVGPGTGIAPFIAFLQQRQYDRASGRNWLFFGDQKESVDFLYREQLTAWQRAGHLARLDMAFSRDGDAKVYVQHRMREHGAELFRWLESGSYFYVCGDARRMARDVDLALQEIIAQHGGRSSAAAKEMLAELKRAKRYVCDVY